MAAATWKGYIAFGLVSIPVKLAKAARPERVVLRQLDRASGSRVRQKLVVEDGPTMPALREAEPEEPAEKPSPKASSKNGPVSAPAMTQPEPAGGPREISRDEIIKGYEFEKNRYARLSKEELASIQPKTTREMTIQEFVKLEDIDPVYFETSYYIAPDKGGEHAYALLYAALKKTGFVGVAQVGMHNREHVVIIRPAKKGLALHTMFYESEIRRENETAPDVSDLKPKELELAVTFVEALEAPFEPGKYHDSYREKLEALIQGKIQEGETTEEAVPRKTAVIDIMEALKKSLEQTAARKPAPPAEAPRKPLEQAEAEPPKRSSSRSRHAKRAS